MGPKTTPSLISKGREGKQHPLGNRVNCVRILEKNDQDDLKKGRTHFFPRKLLDDRVIMLVNTMWDICNIISDIAFYMLGIYM